MVEVVVVVVVVVVVILESDVTFPSGLSVGISPPGNTCGPELSGSFLKTSFSISVLMFTRDTSCL